MQEPKEDKVCMKVQLIIDNCLQESSKMLDKPINDQGPKTAKSDS